MPSILFVCTANVCRSPMAGALFQRQLEQAGLAEAWRVESAGTWGRAGVPASRKAQRVIREWGCDISTHRAQIVNEALLRQFDLILTMERGHKEALHLEFSAHAARIFLLSEMSGSTGNVADPIGGTLSEYRGKARELERLLVAGWDRIRRLAADA